MLLDYFKYTSPPSGSSISGSEHRYQSLETSGTGSNASGIYGYFYYNPVSLLPISSNNYATGGGTGGDNYDSFTLVSISLNKLGFISTSHRTFFAGKLITSICSEGDPRGILQVFNFQLRAHPTILGKLIFSRKRFSKLGHITSNVGIFDSTYSFKIGNTDYLFPGDGTETQDEINFSDGDELQIRQTPTDMTNTGVFVNFKDGTTYTYTGKVIHKAIFILE